MGVSCFGAPPFWVGYIRKPKGNQFRGPLKRDTPISVMVQFLFFFLGPGELRRGNALCSDLLGGRVRVGSELRRSQLPGLEWLLRPVAVANKLDLEQIHSGVEHLSNKAFTPYHGPFKKQSRSNSLPLGSPLAKTRGASRSFPGERRGGGCGAALCHSGGHGEAIPRVVQGEVAKEASGKGGFAKEA